MNYCSKNFTIEEKLKLLSGKDGWSTEDFDGKLYEVVVSDGPVGLRKLVVHKKAVQGEEVPAIAYPSCAVLSQTWNSALAFEMGKCLADDCIEQNVDILLAPGVNIKRSPICGRNFEYFSEDPYLSGVFGREYIAGVQSHHVGTCLKHYCANNSEMGRMWTSSDVDERTLREIYLQPFRIACEADPLTVMCGYNLVNGQRMSEHKKLFRILREEFWREDGLVFSDWGAVKDEVASVRAGLDIKMPYEEGGYERLKAAYDKGELTESEIDACVERVLALIARCAENHEKRKLQSTADERRAVAERIAREGIVLLKNNGVLPLKGGESIMLTGENPDIYYSGKGSSYVSQHAEIATLYEVLKKALPAASIQKTGVQVGWSPNYYQAFEEAYNADVAIVVCGDFETEEYDRTTMRLSREEELQIIEVAARNRNTVVVLRYGSVVDMSAWADKVAAIVWAGYGGERGNEALADILSGKANPSGRLSETFAHHYEYYPAAHTYRTHAVNAYTEGLSVGYRYFDGQKDKVLFPFGYGLSYSSFVYSDIRVEENEKGRLVSFFIENCSEMDGAEVAQVYVREVNSIVPRPMKELKGFAKVSIPAGERKQVQIQLQRQDFAYYSTAIDGWTVKTGEFEILVGKNTQEICLKAVIKIIE